jgi:hypothetical protein
MHFMLMVIGHSLLGVNLGFTVYLEKVISTNTAKRERL